MLQTLKANRITAMKAKDTIAKNILSCLLSDAQTVAKEANRDVTDNDVTEAAKVIIKKNEAVLEYKGSNEDILKKENLILKDYTPQQFTDEQLYALIDKLIAELPESQRGKGMIKLLMPKLNEHGDLVNKRNASKYISSVGERLEVETADGK